MKKIKKERRMIRTKIENMDVDLSQTKYLFLDLDGTLLGLSDDDFEEVYTKLIATRFIDLVEQDVFIKALWEGTEAMYKHDHPDQLVLESFFDIFTDITGIERQEATYRFDQFYKNEFDQLQEVCKTIPSSSELIKVAKSKGIGCILATNPVFPEIATKKRVSWANLDYEEDFLHVTHAENSYVCKPNPLYFKKLVELVDAKPQQCLMVGNDYYFDMAASQIDILTWLTPKYQGNLEHKDKFSIVYKGSLQKLIDNLSNK